MRFNNVIFDVDGTLVDSSEGILNGYRYMFERIGKPVPADEILIKGIGPPMHEILVMFLKTEDEQQISEARAHFRKYYAEAGIFEAKLFEGVLDLLRTLKEKGARMMIVTNKSRPYAVSMLDKLGIGNYFEKMAAQELDKKAVEKTDMLKRLIEENGLRHSESVMIGDTKGDIMAAKNNNITSIAVTHGYESKEELASSQPDMICEGIEHLKKELLR